jgi:hypothetical protein
MAASTLPSYIFKTNYIVVRTQTTTCSKPNKNNNGYTLVLINFYHCHRTINVNNREYIDAKKNKVFKLLLGCPMCFGLS